MKRYIVLIGMLFWAWTLHAQNVMSLSSTSGHPGDTVTLSLSMTNTGSLVALQAMIPLGTQLQYVSRSCIFNASRTNGHQLTASVVDDTLRIYAYSFSLQPFLGSSGELLSFQVVLGAEPGTYPMPICNSKLSTASGNAIPHTMQQGSATILSPKISLGASSIDFGHNPIRSTYTRSVTIQNIGTEPLVIYRLTFNDTTLSCTDNNNTIAAGGSRSYTIRYQPVSAGAVSRRCIIHSNARVGDSIVTIIADPYSVNELRVQATSGYSDSTIRVYLRMNNMDSIVGLQTKIKLPSALTYVPNSFRVENGRSQGHQAIAGMSHDTLNLIIYNLNNRPFLAGDGDVCSFEVRLSGYGYYTLYLLNTQLVEANASNVMSGVYSGSINIYSPSLSAANALDMGCSSVTDTAIASYSIRNSGNAPLSINNVVFTTSGFDVQEALPLTVPNGTTATLHVRYAGTTEGSYSTLMKLYSNDPNRTMFDVNVSCTKYEPNRFALESDSDIEDSIAYVDVVMENYSEITAVQFDIQYPHRFFSVNSSDFNIGTRCGNHMMSAVRQNDSVFRVILFSMTNIPINGNAGRLMTITLHPQGPIPQAAHRIVASRIILGNHLGRNQLSSSDSVCMIGGLPVSVSVQVNNDTMGVATVSGRLMKECNVTLTANANYGYHFKRWNDGNRENPRMVFLTGDTSFVAEFEKNSYRFAYGSADTTRGIVEEINNFQWVPYAEIGTSTSSSNYSPFSNFYRYSTNECLYLASEIGIQGTIDTIAYYVASSASFAYTDLKIYMGTTSETTLENGWVGFDQLQLVYSRQNGTIGSQVGWESYPLDTPFEYNGDENLVVVVCRQSTSYLGSLCYQYSSNSGMCRYRRNDNIADYALLEYEYIGSTSNQRANIHLSFKAVPDTVRKYLTNVQINAIPNAHYHFSHWSDGNTTNPRTLTITQDTLVMAYFSVDQFMVQGESSDSTRGYVTGSGLVDYMDSTWLTVISNYGYHFTRWNDGNTDNPRAIVADRNKTYIASFAPNQYTISANVADPTMGSATGGGSFDYNSAIQIEAIANANYRFLRWNDGNTDNPRQILVTGAGVYTAEFVYCATESHDTAIVCDSYLWGGTTHTTSGTKERTLTNAMGCDSTEYLLLTINHTNTGIHTASVCDSFTWHGVTYTTSTNSPTYNETNVAGCDSIVTLHLSVLRSDTTISASSCESYTWEGNTYTTSTNTPTHTYTNVHNCDSVVTLNLTINYNASSEFSVSACDSYSWHGTTYTSSTTSPTYTEQTVNGCDSVVNLHLTVMYSNMGSHSATACDSYTWYGTTYTSSTDTPTFVETNAAGCDSTVTLHLTVNYSNTGIQNHTACDSYTWHGDTYTSTTTTPTFTETNVAGCDSVVTLHLTINYSNSSTETQTACDSYTWHGNTYTSSTNATFTTTNVAGCDSVVTLNLTISYSTLDTLSLTAQNHYHWNGTDYTESGTYSWQGTTQQGCDSTIVLSLTIETVGIVAIDDNGAITLFPNPTCDKTSLHLNGINETLEIMLVDLNGRVLTKQSVEPGHNEVELNVASLAEGCYFVRIQGSRFNTVKKLIIQ